jgi:hypothetical protein
VFYSVTARFFWLTCRGVYDEHDLCQSVFLLCVHTGLSSVENNTGERKKRALPAVVLKDQSLTILFSTKKVAISLALPLLELILSPSHLKRRHSH